MVIMRNGQVVATDGGEGGSAGINITQSELDALIAAGTVDPDAIYFVTDGESPEQKVIDDTIKSTSTTYSSSKIVELLAGADQLVARGNAGTVSKKGNIDNIYENGVYYCSSMFTENIPSLEGTLFVMNPDPTNNGHTVQIFVSLVDDKMFYRRTKILGTTYADWVKVPTDDELVYKAGDTMEVYGYSAGVITGSSSTLTFSIDLPKPCKSTSCNLVGGSYYLRYADGLVCVKDENNNLLVLSGVSLETISTYCDITYTIKEGAVIVAFKLKTGKFLDSTGANLKTHIMACLSISQGQLAFSY